MTESSLFDPEVKPRKSAGPVLAPVSHPPAPEVGQPRQGSKLRAIAVITGILLLAGFCAVPLSTTEQAFFGLLLVMLGLWLRRADTKSQRITLTMVLLSIFTSSRYIVWRLMITATHPIPGHGWRHAVDLAFVTVLLGAESFAYLTLLLGYFQTLRPLHRQPVPLPDDVRRWPTVDVFIPTYNEPIHVVRQTVISALYMDWPRDKLRVYILDDGKRESFRALADELGAEYIIRSRNNHAKAGNLNHALLKTRGEFVAIFDCDHVPTRSFLQVTLGAFLKDERLALVQTPHHFYSPDPFERNLKQFRRVPNEGELFYGLIQDGNDFWNSSFFCGSCAVLRRKPLEAIGGIAVETVTEDAHTALRMQSLGWRTAYLNLPQAAGLATESLAGHIGQRIRWARGMTQILRTDNPLLKPGLRWHQRLCYLNAMLSFMFAVPRLIFLTAPLAFLLLGRRNIAGSGAALLGLAMPHMIIASITNSRIQGKFRHSFWNEVYEAVLAPYIVLPTLFALVNPKFGKFNVTPKGGLIERSYFDLNTARPFLLLLMLNVAGLFAAVPRFLWWNASDRASVVANLTWALYNMLILAVAAATAFEVHQRRSSVRITMHIPARLSVPEHPDILCETRDLSTSGAALHFRDGDDASAVSATGIIFEHRGREWLFPCEVIGANGGVYRLRFKPLTTEQERMLTLVIYSRADTWIHAALERPVDAPLRSLALIARLAMQGLKMTAKALCRPGTWAAALLFVPCLHLHAATTGRVPVEPHEWLGALRIVLMLVVVAFVTRGLAGPLDGWLERRATARLKGESD
jgi:cellulose synthase (UDP-forming)